VQGFYDRYYFPVRLRARADNTDRLYRFSIRNLSRFLGRHATLDDFTDETVAAMLVWMAGRDKSPYSCEKERSQLLAIWRAAHRKALVTNWPDVQAERLPLRTPAAWMTDDLPKLFAAVKNAPGEIGGVPAGDWMTALHWVLLYSAERIGAVLALEWPDFDGGTGWTTFRAETRKGGREDNSVRLPAAAIAAVERIRKPARKQIFPLDCTMSDLYYFYGKVLKEAGLPHDGKSKFHRMRKTAASHFEAKGGNATALLRHANRKTTLAYLDPRIVTPPQAADLLTGLVASGA
jgi:integrase